MKRFLGYAVILATLLSLTYTAAVAQDNKSENRAKAPDEVGFYKLDFVVRELEDGKTVNTRNYTLMARAGEWQQLRVGTRVPIYAQEKKLEYMDVGLSVDCRILGAEDSAALITKAEITNFAAGEGEKVGASGGAPLIRHVQMNTSAPLSLEKSVLLSGVDELSSKHRFQLEVTVSKAK